MDILSLVIGAVIMLFGVLLGAMIAIGAQNNDDNTKKEKKIL